MSSVQTMNKKQICKLWGVKSSFLKQKLQQVKEIVQTDLYESDILQLLNKHGMDVESVILDIIESNPPNHHNHNHNQNTPTPTTDTDSDSNQTENTQNSVTRKGPEQLTFHTTLHPHPMIGPCVNEGHKWRCDNVLCSKHSIRRPYQMPYFCCANSQCQWNEFVLCETCVTSHSQSQSTRRESTRSNRNRKRKRNDPVQDTKGAPNTKRRKITATNKDDKQEIIALIKSILNEHKKLNRDQLLTKLNAKTTEKRGVSWRRGYQHALGQFDEFVTSIKEHVDISQSYKRNFIVQLKESTDHEIETMDSIDDLDDSASDSNSDTDLAAISDKSEQNAIAMSLSLDPPSDTESIEVLKNKNDSFIFPEIEPEITTHNRPCSSSKQERDTDDEDTNPPQATTNTSTSVIRSQMKAEADSDDDLYDPNEETDAPPIVVSNHNKPTVIKPKKAVDKKWKKKVFNRFEFEYSVVPKKDPPKWYNFKMEDVKVVDRVHDLFDLRSERGAFLKEIKMKYDTKYMSNDDRSILKQLYDQTFEELRGKQQKPKKYKAHEHKKKHRKDYTIQAIIKKSKDLHWPKNAKKKKRFGVEIEIEMHRYNKSGNCFVVDIPATIALTTKQIPLQEDIYESLNITKEFNAKGHQNTSISLLDFACRYNTDGIKRFEFGTQCRICYAIPMRNRKELPCGHRFCTSCIAKHFELRIKCPVCGKKYNDVDFVADLLMEAMIDDEDDEMKEEDVMMEEQQEEQPYGLNVIAFPYQVQSIEWMVERENDAEGLYKYLFRKGTFKNGEVFYYSAVLNRLVLTESLPVLRGGFLCEEMGLGKTIECLALIQCNKRSDAYSTGKRLVVAFKETALRKKRVEIKPKKKAISRRINDEDEDVDMMMALEKKKKKKPKKIYKFVEQMKEYTYYKSKSTLIIGPVSLIGQWENEIDTRTNGKLRYKRYYGQRSRNIHHYFDYDIVFTTFGVLAKEDGHDRKNHALHRMEWHRIILDESHYIKNGAARTSININELQATSKWLLSGTPFERPIDLFNQLKFIGIEQEYINAMGLKEKSLRPWQSQSYSAALMKVVKYLMMRHKKGQTFNNKAIVRMQEKDEDVIYVEFDAKQKEYYDKLYATAKQTFDSFKATGNIARGFIPILSSLHPARQACSGYIASMNAIEEQLSAAQESTHKIRVMVQQNKNKSCKELYELARVDAYNKDGQCVICLECPPDEPLQTPCRHIFCGECIHAQLEANGECPICRKKTDVSRLKLPPSEKAKKEAQDKEKEKENHNNSNNNNNEEEENKQNEIKFDAKLKVLISKIKELPSDDKALIFTSFSKSLDWICQELERNDIEYSTLTGSMTMNKRAKNLKQFSNASSDTKVFVLTVRTGAVGLTLTAANHVFMMEPTFNPALHRQAINRVYRLGQDKKVFIHTLIMKESIEERIWNINKEKQKGEIDNKQNKNMYGNIKDDKAGALQTTEIEKLFTI